MKFFIALSFCCAFHIGSFVQSWDIYHNGRKLLEGHDSFPESSYIIDISSAALDSLGGLVVEYKGSEQTIHGWKLIQTIAVTTRKFRVLYSMR